MIIRNIPLRHELKYFITPAELTVLPENGADKTPD